MSSTQLFAVILLSFSSAVSAAKMSCEGRCGVAYFRGFECQCDYTCVQYDECCPDFESLCTTQSSCRGRCGEAFRRGRLCSCDAECDKYKQCCPDYKLSCNAAETEISEAANLTAPQRTNSCDNVTDNKPNEDTTEELERRFVTPIPIYMLTPTPADTNSGSGSAVSGASPLPSHSGSSGSGMETTAPPEFASATPDSSGSGTTMQTSGGSAEADNSGQTSSPDTYTTTVASSTTVNHQASGGSTYSSASASGGFESSTSSPVSMVTTTLVPTMTPSHNPSTSGYSESGSSEPEHSTESSTSTSGYSESGSSEPEHTTESSTSTSGYSESGSSEPKHSTESSTGSDSLTTIAPVPTTTNQYNSEETTAEPVGITQTPNPLLPPPTPRTATTLNSHEEPDLYQPKPVDPTPTQAPESHPEPEPETEPQPEQERKPKPETGKKPKPKATDEPKPQESEETVNKDDSAEYQADDSNSTNLCSGRPANGVTTLRNGTMVVFRGHHFWMLDGNRVPGEARRIADVWGVPSPIDTVFTRCNCQGKTYIFKGGQYWRFDNTVLDPGYPKVVAVGFDGLRGHITAALSVPQFNRRRESVYFFKKGGTVQKYSYQFGTSPSCGRNAPRITFTVRKRPTRQAVSRLEPAISIRTSWRGFPTSVSAAVSVPTRYIPEGYKYYVFSKSKVYNVQMDGRHPVVAAQDANPPPQINSENDFFKCPPKM